MLTRAAVASDREVWIDCLRGLAATAVALYHFNAIGPMPGVYNTILLKGHIGVSVFFIVSGYCMAKTCRKAPDWRVFLINRLLRIYLPFWFNMATICAIVGWRLAVFGTNDVTVVPKSVYAFIAHSLLLIEPVTTLKGMNWVYWTLIFELAFYVVVAASLALGAVIGRALLIAVTLASLVPVVANAPPLFFLSQWGLFAFGFSVASIRQKRDPFGVFLLMFSIFSLGVNLHEGYVFSAVLFIVLAMGQKLVFRARGSVSVRMLSALGTISYSVYLLHVPVGVFILGWALYSGGTRGALEAASINILLFLVVVAVSAIAYRYVEAPSISLGRRLGRRWARERGRPSCGISRSSLEV